MKLELTRGCRSFTFFKDEEDIYKMAEGMVRQTIIEVIDALVKKEEISYVEVLEDIVQSDGAGSIDGPCDQCGDYVNTHKLEI